MKKLFLFVLLSLVSTFGFSNMSQYYNNGKLIAEPFISEFVSITDEKLAIHLNKDFSSANYLVNYTIYATKDGEQIPMLFYAPDYKSDFTILFNGKPVKIETIYNKEAPELESYQKYFNKDDDSVYNLPTSSTSNRRTTLGEYIYFVLDIPIGEHKIEVSYTSNPWVDSENGFVKNYHFRYALKPAKEWQSFSNLKVELHNITSGKTVETNLGIPTSAATKGITTWQFNTLPLDMIEVTYKPDISILAQFFLIFKSLGLALLVVVLLGIFHFKLIPGKSKQRSRTPYLIIGSLIISCIAIAIYLYLDNVGYQFFIGEHAYGRGYASIYFSLVYFPILLISYYVAMWFYYAL